MMASSQDLLAAADAWPGSWQTAPGGGHACAYELLWWRLGFCGLEVPQDHLHGG